MRGSCAAKYYVAKFCGVLKCTLNIDIIAGQECGCRRTFEGVGCDARAVTIVVRYLDQSRVHRRLTPMWGDSSALSQHCHFRPSHPEICDRYQPECTSERSRGRCDPFMHRPMSQPPASVFVLCCRLLPPFLCPLIVFLFFDFSLFLLPRLISSASTRVFNRIEFIVVRWVRWVLLDRCESSAP